VHAPFSNGERMRNTIIFIFLFLFLTMAPGDAASEVIVDDMVASLGVKIMLRAETKGFFFRKGGELVEFFVEGKSLGKNLSGGDGVAFKEFIPQRAGLLRVEVTSGNDRDNGALYVAKRGAQVVLIDIEGSLTEKPLMDRAKPGSADAVKRINESFPVIFLRTNILTMKAGRMWLQKQGFPPGPVLSWKGGDVFQELKDIGIRIKAVIGTPDVIKSAKTSTSFFFSFDPVAEGESVDDWEKIEKKLRPSSRR